MMSMGRVILVASLLLIGVGDAAEQVREPRQVAGAGGLESIERLEQLAERVLLVSSDIRRFEP